MLKLAHILPIDRYLKAARDEARRVCERWDVPKGKDTTDDLRDVRGWYMSTADGFRVSGLLLDADMQHGSDSPALPLMLAHFPVCAALTPIVYALLGLPGAALMALIISALTVLCISATGFLGAVAALLLGVVLPLTGGIPAQALMGMTSTWSSIGAMPVLVVVGALFLFGKHPVVKVLAVALVCLGFLSVVDSLLAFLLHFPSGWAMWVASCALPMAFALQRHAARALALAHQGNIATIASSMPLAMAHTAARAQQAERALSDTTAFLRLGTSKGVFVGKMDPYSPDKGLPFGLTVADADTHVTIFGSTGTGKTMTLLKPFVVEVRRAMSAVGMILLDGKGSLPGEFARMAGYTLIEPGRVQLGLVEGLEPTDVVLALMNINQPKSESGSSKFFITQAGEMARHICVFLKELVEVEKALEASGGAKRRWRWCLQDIYGMGVRAQRSNKDMTAKMDGYIATVKQHSGAKIGENVLGDAILYLTTILPGMDNETRSNVWSTLQGWLTPLTSHPDLRAWANVENGISFDSVFYGRGDFGICTPEVKYGVGGSLVQSLVKQRLTTRIRKRADYDWRAGGEAPVVFIVDEAQEIVGVEDRIILPIARSLGARMVYATQNIENYIVRLGGVHEANGFLDCFQSAFCFKSSPATMQWMQARLGQTMTLVPHTSAGHVAFEQNSRIAAEGPMSDPQHSGSWVYRMLARQGGAGTASTIRQSGLLRHASGEGMDFDKLSFNTASIRGAEMKLQPLLLDSEYDTYTAEKFVAVAQVMRGGVRRRDVIETKPLFTLPEDIMAPVERVAKPTKQAPQHVDLGPPDEPDDESSTAARERTSRAFRDDDNATATDSPEQRAKEKPVAKTDEEPSELTPPTLPRTAPSP